MRVALAIVAGCGFTGPPSGAKPVDAPPVPMHDAPGTFVITDAPDVADTSLLFATPDTPDGFESIVRVDSVGMASVALLRFDLSGIAAPIASVEMHIWTEANHTPDPVDVYVMLVAWAEASACWNRSPAIQLWGGAAPPARTSTPSATFIPAADQTEYTVALPPEVVAAWVAAPNANFGIALATSSSDGSTYHSREYGTASKRPFLRVVHAQ